MVWQAQGILLFWWSEVDFSLCRCRRRSRFTSMCRFRGRCCALDLATSDSVARAVNREPWTCGLFFQLQAYMSLPLRGALQIAKHGPCHEICTSRLTTCPTWHEVRPSGFLSPASAFRKKSTRCQRQYFSSILRLLKLPWPCKIFFITNLAEIHGITMLDTVAHSFMSY